MTPVILSFIHSLLVRHYITKKSAHITRVQLDTVHKVDAAAAAQSVKDTEHNQHSGHYHDVWQHRRFYLFLTFIEMEMYSMYFSCLPFFFFFLLNGLLVRFPFWWLQTVL